MSAADFTLDPHFTTPDGVVLNKLARNPHFNVDIVHGDQSSGEHPVDSVTFNLSVPDIDNGQSFIETINPPVLSNAQYATSLSGEYDNEPMVLVNIERISPTTFRVEIQNQSGSMITARPAVINFS